MAPASGRLEAVWAFVRKKGLDFALGVAILGTVFGAVPSEIMARQEIHCPVRIDPPSSLAFFDGVPLL